MLTLQNLQRPLTSISGDGKTAFESGARRIDPSEIERGSPTRPTHSLLYGREPSLVVEILQEDLAKNRQVAVEGRHHRALELSRTRARAGALSACGAPPIALGGDQNETFSRRCGLAAQELVET